MLASIRGTVIHLSQNTAVIETGGLGFEVQLSRRAMTMCVLQEPVFLQTWLQIAETGASLFGFADDVERQTFRLLLSVKGIGARLAIAVLQVLSASEVMTAITTRDGKVLTSVPGVGKKTAERICFELADKIASGDVEWGGEALPSVSSHNEEVLDALESLGFERSRALKAYQLLCEKNGLPVSTEEAIFGCLQLLKSH